MHVVHSEHRHLAETGEMILVIPSSYSRPPAYPRAVPSASRILSKYYENIRLDHMLLYSELNSSVIRLKSVRCITVLMCK